MKTPAEKISLLIMRDNGEVRSVRIRRSLLFLLLFMCAVMPFLLGGALWFGADVWLAHRALFARHNAMQQEYLEAKATAARLSDIEQLVQAAEAQNSAQVLQNIRRADAQAVAQPPEGDPAHETGVSIDGPGHVEFPAVNSGKVQTDNVTIRQMSGRSLRISLDLSNPDPTTPVAGKIVCILTTANGQTLPLRVFPQSADDFRISRFKRVVLTAPLPPNVNAADAQVVLEIKAEGGGPILYRNVYAVAR